MRQTFTLKGTMRAITPIHQGVFTGDDNKELGIKRLPRLGIVSNLAPRVKSKSAEEEHAEEAVETAHHYLEIPILTANGFRGFLRRACAYVIFDKYRLTGTKIPVPIANWMRAGASPNPSATLPKHVTPSVLDREVNEEGNIHTGLFGAGLNCPSSLAVSDICPMTWEMDQLNLLYGLMPPDTLPRAWEVKAVRGWVRKSDFHQPGRKDEYEYFDAADVESFLMQIQEERAKRKEKKGKKESQTEEGESTRGEIGHVGLVEYIKPGTEMAVRFRFQNVSPQQVGLFLAGLDRISDHPYFGAYTRWDFGRFTLNLQDESGRSVILSDEGLDAEGFGAEQEAFQSWLAGIQLERLNTCAYFEKDGA